MNTIVNPLDSIVYVPTSVSSNLSFKHYLVIALGLLGSLVLLYYIYKLIKREINGQSAVNQLHEKALKITIDNIKNLDKKVTTINQVHSKLGFNKV